MVEALHFWLTALLLGSSAWVLGAYWPLSTLPGPFPAILVAVVLTALYLMIWDVIFFLDIVMLDTCSAWRPLGGLAILTAGLLYAVAWHLRKPEEIV